MNACFLEEATEIDYLMTKEPGNQVTGEWIVKTFSQRNYLKSGKGLGIIRLVR
jgi:hypothetical protein